MDEVNFSCATADGRAVELIWDEYETKMSVRTASEPKQEIGHIEFRLIEHGTGGEHLHVTSMFLEGPEGTKAYIRQGIGERIIRQITEMGYHVTFSVDDGLQRPDGSHLTGTGVPFARKMVENGLATWSD